MKLRLLKTSAFIPAIFFSLSHANAQKPRPAITGISHMCVYAADPVASNHFYGYILGAPKGPDPQDASGARYSFSATQFVEVLPLPASHTVSRMSCVAFQTVDAEGLHEYLHNHAVNGLGEVQSASDGSRWFKTLDPEGNLVQFIQPGRSVALTALPSRSVRGSSTSVTSSTAKPLKTGSTAISSASAPTGTAQCSRARWTGSRCRSPMVTTGSNT